MEICKLGGRRKSPKPVCEYHQLWAKGCKFLSDDNTMGEDNPLKKSFDLFTGTMRILGREFPVAGTLQARLEEAGFVDVKELSYKQPYGPWPKDKRSGRFQPRG